MYKFNDIIGNKNIVKYLQNIIEEEKVPQAFIFDGASGTGKTFISNIFAKTLQCEKHGNEPCLECVSCRAFDNDNHPDIIRLSLKDKKSIGVEEVREGINNLVSIKPYKYPYKIFIIDDADKLTVQAQNALLKTIEEPPVYAIFILKSANYKIFLPTIISRCVLLKIKPLPYIKVSDYLSSKFDISKNNSEIAGFFSEGSIGRGIEFLNDEYLKSMREKIISFLISFKNMSLTDLFASAKIFDEYKDNVKDVFDFMYVWYRDILVYKETESFNFVLDKSNFEKIKNESFEYSKNKLYNILDAIDKAKYSIHYYGNFNLTIEVMLITMKE